MSRACNYFPEKLNIINCESNDTIDTFSVALAWPTDEGEDWDTFYFENATVINQNFRKVSL